MSNSNKLSFQFRFKKQHQCIWNVFAFVFVVGSQFLLHSCCLCWVGTCYRNYKSNISGVYVKQEKYWLLINANVKAWKTLSCFPIFPLAQFSHEPSTFKKALVNQLFRSKPWTARVILGLTMFACRQLMRVWLVQFSTNWWRLNQFSKWKRELIEKDDNITWGAPPLRPGPLN